jgi:hypothetical protein
MWWLRPTERIGLLGDLRRDWLENDETLVNHTLA